MKEQLAQEILDALLSQSPISFAELHRKIGGNRNTLKKTIDELIRSGMVRKNTKSRGTAVELFLIKTDLSVHLDHLERELPLLKIMIKRVMKVLKKHKYLFKFPVPVGKPIHHPTIPGAKTVPPVTWKINPKAKRDLQFLINGINRLFEHSGALTTADSLGLIPKGYTKIIRKYQKNCIGLIKSTVNDLVKVHPEEKWIIHMYLELNTRGMTSLSAISRLSKV